MSKYLFPEVDRVVYAKAPLAEVICQVRFPADLRIDTKPPADFQQQVRSSFPILAQLTQGLLPAMSPDVAKAMEWITPVPGPGSVWQFSSEDGKHTLQLVKDNLTLISHDYRRWEVFYALFDGPLRALGELYQPPFYTRVGLRYRDLIQRSKVGLDGDKWSALLAPHVLAEIAERDFEDRTEQAFRNILLKLPEHGARVRLQHGFAEVDGSSEQTYLIDCDFFVDKTEVENASGALNYFHDNAARFFRWCITPKLHNAMEPRSVTA
jgi:uncharacterized protein (TIGR04255 family)